MRIILQTSDFYHLDLNLPTRSLLLLLNVSATSKWQKPVHALAKVDLYACSIVSKLLTNKTVFLHFFCLPLPRGTNQDSILYPTINLDETFGDSFVFNISVSVSNLGKKLEQERARAQKRQRY